VDPIKKFIAYAEAAMSKAGVTVKLPGTDLIEFSPGELCSGYFTDEDPKNPEFVVATGRPPDKWFPIFVHEFCHFEQWRDRNDWWETFKLADGSEPLDAAIEHFAGNLDLTPEQVIDYCVLQAQVEIDCERRVLAKIAEHNLPIDAKLYAKWANSYIAYYYAMPSLQGWCNGERPYDVAEIIEAVPAHLDLTDADYFALADKLLPIYRERCLHAQEQCSHAEVNPW